MTTLRSFCVCIHESYMRFQYNEETGLIHCPKCNYPSWYSLYPEELSQSEY
jgi:hypothetical protein